MANELPVYSAREVGLYWGGIPLEGFSEDNIVKMSYNSDLTSEKVGCDGKLATSVTPDRTGTVVIELMATSETNRMFSAILAAQNSRANTADIYKAAIEVTDPAGQSICIAHNAYFKKAPEVGLGVETGTAEWTFYASKIEFLTRPNGAVKDNAFMTKVKSLMASLASKALR